MPEPMITTSVSCDLSRLAAAGGCWSTERAAQGRSGRLRLAGAAVTGLNGFAASLQEFDGAASRRRSPGAQAERACSASAIARRSGDFG